MRRLEEVVAELQNQRYERKRLEEAKSRLEDKVCGLFGQCGGWSLFYVVSAVGIDAHGGRKRAFKG